MNSRHTKIKSGKYTIKKNKRNGSKPKKTIQYIQIGGDVECGQHLGQGGFGIAHLCKNGDQTVAVLKTSKLENDAVLNNEIKIIRKLSHNNIVLQILPSDVNGLKTLSEAHYYLEYCDDGDLESYSKKNKFEEVKTNDCFTQVFNGLRYLYDQQIVHADIKEPNILVKSGNPGNPTYKIADFGISIDIGTEFTGDSIDRTKLFKNGSIGYVPLFMRYTTYFRDLYALFCVIYKIITGEMFNDLSTVLGASNARIITDEDLPADTVSKYQQFNKFYRNLIELQDILADNNYLNPDIIIVQPANQERVAGYNYASPQGGGATQNLVNGYFLAANNKETTTVFSTNFKITQDTKLLVDKQTDNNLYTSCYKN